jgi:hypothetical protein
LANTSINAIKSTMAEDVQKESDENKELDESKGKKATEEI